MLIYLDLREVARRELEDLVESPDSQTRGRARELLDRLFELPTFYDGPFANSELRESLDSEADLPRFTIGGKRELPLLETQFDDDDDDTMELRPETTITARLFAPFLDEQTSPSGIPAETTSPTITQTAIIGRGPRTPPLTVPPGRDVTATALLPGRAKEGVTAEPTRTAVALRRERGLLAPDGEDE